MQKFDDFGDDGVVNGEIYLRERRRWFGMRWSFVLEKPQSLGIPCACEEAVIIVGNNDLICIECCCAAGVTEFSDGDQRVR